MPFNYFDSLNHVLQTYLLVLHLKKAFVLVSKLSLVLYIYHFRYDLLYFNLFDPLYPEIVLTNCMACVECTHHFVFLSCREEFPSFNAYGKNVSNL